MKQIKKMIIIVITIFTFTACNNGVMLETIESTHDVPTTLAKLKTLLEKKGLTHFATIDHQANADNIGMPLNADTVVIFGNPKVGTVLMQCNSSLGIDLPLRILLRTNDAGKTTISYFNPEYWRMKHDITDDKCLKILKNTKKALANMSKAIAN